MSVIETKMEPGWFTDCWSKSGIAHWFIPVDKEARSICGRWKRITDLQSEAVKHCTKCEGFFPKE